MLDYENKENTLYPMRGKRRNNIIINTILRSTKELDQDRTLIKIKSLLVNSITLNCSIKNNVYTTLLKKKRKKVILAELQANFTANSKRHKNSLNSVLGGFVINQSTITPSIIEILAPEKGTTALYLGDKDTYNKPIIRLVLKHNKNKRENFEEIDNMLYNNEISAIESE